MIYQSIRFVCPKNLLIKPDKGTFLQQLFLFILYTKSADIPVNQI